MANNHDPHLLEPLDPGSTQLKNWVVMVTGEVFTAGGRVRLQLLHTRCY